MRDDDRCARAWQVFVDGIPPGTDRRDAIALSVMIVIPSVFAARTITRDGDAGRAWIDRLPGVVAAYLERWDLTPDGPVMHGYVAIVLPVVRPGDERAVLKVSWLDGDDFWEAHALAAWDGRGAVRVLEHDDPAGVLLLERLDPAWA